MPRPGRVVPLSANRSPSSSSEANGQPALASAEWLTDETRRLAGALAGKHFGLEGARPIDIAHRACEDESRFQHFSITSMWKKPDFILVAAVSGIVGASLVASGYFLFLAAPSAEFVQPSPPPNIPPELVLTPEVAADRPPVEAGPDMTPSNQDTAVTQKSAVEEGRPKGLASKVSPLVDHRYDGVITPDEVVQIRASLRLSPDQEPKWRALATSLREAGTQQKTRIDAGQQLSSAFNEEVSSQLIPSALPLLHSFRDDQWKGAGRLLRVLGFKNSAALREAANVPAEPVEQKKVEPRVAAAAVPPPAAKVPALGIGRYDGLLTPAEIGRIKLSLKLRPEQEAYWPPVAAILREMGQQQMAQVDAGQQLDMSMSGDLAQRFYLAASPLLQTLTEEQKSEVRRRARIMGLQAYAAYL